MYASTVAELFETGHALAACREVRRAGSFEGLTKDVKEQL